MLMTGRLRAWLRYRRLLARAIAGIEDQNHKVTVAHYRQLDAQARSDAGLRPRRVRT